MYIRLLKTENNKSFFLYGPRGTGKTTWLRYSFPNAIFLDLLEAEIYNVLLANPQRLENFIPNNFRDWVIVDEIQKIPELLDEVHRLIEKKKNKFILSGSSARKLRKAGHNLLAGRALTYRMHPFCATELGDDFKLEHSLRFGHLPSVYVEENPKAYLESYVKTYMEEEVRQEGLTRNLNAFARFLESASFSQGSVLNITSVARECSVERKIVENYFSILDDLLIGCRIPVFTKRAKRRMISHPKFYFFDCGVFRTLRPMGVLDRPEEAEGVAFESLFLQELIAINDSLSLNYKIFFWRTVNNTEVDFVLYGERGLLAFELKRSGKVNNFMLKGLNSFIRSYPMAKSFLIYGGSLYQRENNIDIIPAIEAFKNLPEILITGKYKIN